MAITKKIQIILRSNNAQVTLVDYKNMKKQFFWWNNGVLFMAKRVKTNSTQEENSCYENWKRQKKGRDIEKEKKKGRDQGRSSVPDTSA